MNWRLDESFNLCQKFCMSLASKLFVCGLAVLSPAVFAASPFSGVTTFDSLPESLSLVSGVANFTPLQATIAGYDFSLRMIDATPVMLNVEDLAWDSGNGVDYAKTDWNAASLASFTVSANSGERFDLLGFSLSLTSMGNDNGSMVVVFTGFRGGVVVASDSRTLALSSSSSQDLEAFVGGANFKGIDSFSITPGAGHEIGYLGIDNINAINFVPEPSSVMVFGALAALATFRRRR